MDTTDNALQVFNFENQQVDILTIEGNPWFVGRQIATILGYKYPKDAIRDNVDDEDKQVFTKKEFEQMASIQEGEQTPLSYINGLFGESAMGGVQRLTIINESGLYSLILSSKLKSAKEFKRWVTNEVLPSIRKHGVYATEDVIEKSLTDPDWAISILQELKAERQKTRHLQQTVAVMAPKAHVWDKIVDDDGHISWRNACNLIRSPDGTIIKENVIRKRLVTEEGWMYKAAPGTYRPYKSVMDGGYMVVKLAPDKYGKYYPCNFFTTKGMQKLLEMFSHVEDF